MQVEPNFTVVRGTVRSIRPEPDGWGAAMELEVKRNESPRPEKDFIRPASGSILEVFSPEPHLVRVGEVIRADARLNAGPTGGRIVLSNISKVE